ncbi:MAG: hypothetical protein ERJ67_00655 [Aphanocapsa feldmannii 277cV]|uniref:Uncharacterized protein n=2 Tax=Aphanocapsa feldmannii TaxID=192050 RepID=A0A524RR23_9CHRO|nr:MAG: hypothetical protein ERJ69_01915 [Aphanocapsa feldmannii 288cV]TGG96631.1 MAG: hypothetical protein ERJ67_00655 [Aphanocapsa feldmannii 277cV]TGH21197.1 MAG: hypothetical protein ERJ68_05795 [Aphanocapsa feldmannii 277cI]
MDSTDAPTMTLNERHARGETVKVEGTNVVRVPFGVRRARRVRPARQANWATLVVPIASGGSFPTPPPHAA